MSRPEDIVRSLLDLYLPGGVRPDVRAKLVAFVAAGQARRRRPRSSGARGRPRHPDDGGISTGVGVPHRPSRSTAHVSPPAVPDPRVEGSSLVALNAMVPQFVARTAHAAAPGKDNILVVLEMTGGNDGLNTVIPYADDLYHKARPTLRQTKNDVIRLDDHVGLHSGDAGLPADVGAGAVGGRAGRRLPEPAALALRGHGHLAVGRSSRGDRERLAGPGGGREGRPLGRGADPAHRPRPPAARRDRGAGGRGGHCQRPELLPPRAGWRPGRAAEGPTPAAGRAGGTDREGRGKRPGLVRAATAGADADGGRDNCASCSKDPTPYRGRAAASARSFN